jgi:hypothetical protein
VIYIFIGARVAEDFATVLNEMDSDDEGILHYICLKVLSYIDGLF